MDLVQEWLAPTIEEELGQVLKWRENPNNRSGSIARPGELKFEDDGSNLRVFSRKAGAILQISKFRHWDELIKVSLSDSVNHIDASFAASATRKYQERKRQPLTQDTIGGLIQLLDFEVVATHFGPRQSRLTLLVKDFKILGSTGSGEKGIPQDIESRLRHLVDRLEQQRKRDSAMSRESSTRGSSPRAPSIQSQAGSLISEEETLKDPQATFATQVPLTKRAFQPRAKAQGKYTVNGGTSLNQKALLERLKQKNRPKPNMSSKPPSAASAAARSPLPTAETSEPGDHAPTSIEVHPTYTASHTKELTLPGDEALMTSAKSLREPSFQMEVEVSAGQISQPRLASPRGRVEPLLKTRQIRKKIRRRDVTISKDQEALLSQANSWIPAEPGQREPVANIPISILNSLNRQAEHTELVSKDCEPSHSPLDAEDSLNEPPKSEAESDIPISSGEWPASPERGQLPPDSRSPSPTHFAQVLEESALSAPREQSPRFSQALVPPQSRGSRGENIATGPDRPESLVKSPSGNASPSAKFDPDSEGQELSSSFNALASPKVLYNTGKISNMDSSSDIDLDHPSKSDTRAEVESIESSAVDKSNVEFDAPTKSESSTIQLALKTTLSSRPSSSDSDLEMTVPVPLRESGPAEASVPRSQDCLSTAPQTVQSFTQVKRTPYVNGYSRSDCPNMSEINDLSSSTKMKSTITPINGTEHDILFAYPEMVLCSYPNKSSLSDKSVFARSTDSKSGQVTLKEISGTKIRQQTHGPRAPRGRRHSLEQSLSQENSGEVIDSYSRSEEPMPHVERGNEPKRSRSLSSTSSPRPKKRNKLLDLFKDVPTLPYSTRGRQDKRDWLSRRSSESSASLMSPKSPQKGGFGFPALDTSAESLDLRKSKVDNTGTSMADSSRPPRLHQELGKIISVMQANVPGENAITPYTPPHRANSPSFQRDADARAGAQEEDSNGQEDHITPPHHEKEQTLATSSATEIPNAQKAISRNQPSTMPSHGSPVALESEPRPSSVLDASPVNASPQGSDVCRHAAESPQEVQPSSALTIFDRFKAMYPDYPGTLKHFVALCHKINDLLKVERTEHPSLWDDFIIRHELSYAQYGLHCKDEAKDPLPYELYYRTIIEEPMYTGRILTRRTLPEALSIGLQVRKIEERPSVTTKLSAENSPPLNAPSRSDKPQAVVRSPKADAVIDLTSDDEPPKSQKDPESTLKASSNKKAESSQRSLPWAPVHEEREDTATGSPQTPKLKRHRERSKAREPETRPKAPRLLQKASIFTRFHRCAPGSQDSLQTQEVIASESKQWWYDDNTPYRSFARAFTSVQPGNNNSYAKPDKSLGEERSHRKRWRADILGWSLD